MGLSMSTPTIVRSPRAEIGPAQETVSNRLWLRATADERAAMTIAVKSWIETMSERGVRLHGAPLQSAGEAKIVCVHDGELLVSDGPFAETKEQIGGYDVVQCTDLDAAVQVAAGHPLARTARVEVRPFWDAPWQ